MTDHTDRTEALDIEAQRNAIQGALSWMSLRLADGTNMDDANDRHIGAISALDRLIQALRAAQEGWKAGLSLAETHYSVLVERDEAREALRASNEERGRVRVLVEKAKSEGRLPGYNGCAVWVASLEAALSTPEQPVADPETEEPAPWAGTYNDSTIDYDDD